MLELESKSQDTNIFDEDRNAYRWHMLWVMKRHLFYLVFKFHFSKKKGDGFVIYEDGTESLKKLHHTYYSNEKDQYKNYQRNDIQQQFLVFLYCFFLKPLGFEKKRQKILGKFLILYIMAGHCTFGYSICYSLGSTKKNWQFKL